MRGADFPDRKYDRCQPASVCDGGERSASGPVYGHREAFCSEKCDPVPDRVFPGHPVSRTHGNRMDRGRQHGRRDDRICVHFFRDSFHCTERGQKVLHRHGDYGHRLFPADGRIFLPSHFPRSKFPFRGVLPDPCRMEPARFHLFPLCV